jgi:AraC-like DNA-binding protein
MDLTCIERPSDSPFVERIWYSQSETVEPFISIAEYRWEMVVTRYRGQAFLTLRGPETRATHADNLADAEFCGIQFKPGVYMPLFPPGMIMDRCDLNLPEAGDYSFWLHGSSWQLPDFENADDFIEDLTREGLLACDSLVIATRNGQPAEFSARTVQRRFLQSTGITLAAARQIERARLATRLLLEGSSILDAAYQTGYFDQQHLTHALKRFIGMTPSQVAKQSRSEQLSFLYKTDASYSSTIPTIIDNAGIY